MNITHISVSRKQVFDECQQKYKYKYHLSLDSGEPEPIYFAYGSIVHKIAEEYVRAKGERHITDVAQDVLDGKIELEPGVKALPLSGEYKKKLPEHLKAIAKITQQTGFDGELEYEFKYDLDPPHGRFVTGYIDRLIQKGDKFWILDYKTTKQGWWRKGPKDIVNDLQLRVYARVVQRNFGAKAENIKAALYYLDGAELVGVCFTEQSLKQAEEELLQTYLDIQNTPADLAKGKVGNHCQRCDYKKICPFFTHGQNYLKKLGLD
jgi:CRISPR/Cas system-associated exonuclease Cas4 (RecB family)